MGKITIAARQLLRLEKSLGSIEPGKLADILILDANPLASIQNSRKISKVIKGGRIASRGRSSEA